MRARYGAAKRTTQDTLFWMLDRVNDTLVSAAVVVDALLDLRGALPEHEDRIDMYLASVAWVTIVRGAIVSDMAATLLDDAAELAEHRAELAAGLI